MGSRGAARSPVGARSSRSTEDKEKLVPRDILTRVERDIMLQIVDQQWKDHLYSLDHLKEGIGLRGYGQRDPLVEYKKESFALFQDMRIRIEEEIVRYLVVAEAGGRARRRRGQGRPCRSRPAAKRPAALNYNNPQEQPTSIFPPAGQPAAPAGRAIDLGRRIASRPRGRRRRRDQDGEARRAEDRPQRSVLVRQRQEIQEVPRA